MRNGIKICKPTSIAYSGTSASIVGQGSVEFSAVTSLSLNGVFSSDYDNYVISIRNVGSTNANLELRYRASGTDATGSNYIHQTISVSSTTVVGSRSVSSTSNRICETSATARSGLQVFIYGPNLAQPTALRSLSALGEGSAKIYEQAATHSLSTAYDGITLFPSSGSFSGMITVYGLVD